jgi:phosphoribosylformimino-5-aminoimidazole carboxamide ribotide isomerase
MPITLVPSIDLRGGQVVRLKRGDYAQQIAYDLDPAQTAQRFAAAGAQWLHIVDLDGAREGRPVQTELIARIIQASGLKVQVGGGIRDRQDIQRLLETGATRVVLGTRAMEDWQWFRELVHEPALEQRIVLALDARDGVVATRGWTQSSGRMAVKVAREVSNWPLAGILYTDVARDGMLEGPNLEQTRRLAEAGRVPVIASGGVGTIEHVRQLAQLPIWGAIVGRSLYEGTVDLGEALEVARGGPGVQ